MSSVASRHPEGRAETPGHPVPFAEALRVWIRIGLLSFGGPAGQIALMHRILVEEKRWISDTRFLHALNYCMLLPGPEAQQLATYIGWLLHRTAGGLAAGILFILPGAAAIMGLSVVYAVFGNVDLVQALFFGLKAAVLAIVLQAVLRVGRRALANPVMVAFAGAAFVALFVFGVPFPLVILAAGLAGYIGGRLNLAAFRAADGHGAPGGNEPVVDRLVGDGVLEHAKPSIRRSLRVALVWLTLWLAPVGALVLLLGSADTFSQIALFFSKMAVVTFGGAYAVLAYVAQQAVQNYGWLQPGEMLDGLGLAETTPGPLIMVVQFVGFLAAFRDPEMLSPLWSGVLGGLLATWVTFTPCFLWIFLGAPYVEAIRGRRALNAALATITAAVVGVILNLALWFGLHVLFRDMVVVDVLGISLGLPDLASVDPAAVALTALAVSCLLWLRMGVVATLGACAAAGLALSFWPGVS